MGIPRLVNSGIAQRACTAGKGRNSAATVSPTVVIQGQNTVSTATTHAVFVSGLRFQSELQLRARKNAPGNSSTWL